MTRSEFLNQLMDYWVNTLIVQYHNKPKAQAHIRTIVEQVLCSGIFFDIRDAYDVDTAVGKQLDIIGKYAGVDRFYVGQNLTGLFALTNYAETVPDAGKRGFAEQAEWATKEGKTLLYDNTLSVDLRLNDQDFRVLIKLKIIQNNSDHSHKSIDDAMFSAFGTAVRADSQGNMIMHYFVPVNKTEIIKVAIQKKILPRPMGVRLNWLIEEQDGFFGFTDYEDVGAGKGLTTYADYNSSVGQTLSYSSLT